MSSKEASGTACTPSISRQGPRGEHDLGQQRDSSRLDSTWANKSSSEVLDYPCSRPLMRHIYILATGFRLHKQDIEN